MPACKTQASAAESCACPENSLVHPCAPSGKPSTCLCLGWARSRAVRRSDTLDGSAALSSQRSRRSAGQCFTPCPKLKLKQQLLSSTQAGVRGCDLYAAGLEPV